MGSVFDCDADFGEVAVADDAAELLFGFEHSGRGPAEAHLAGLPAFGVAAGASADLDHRLAGAGRLERSFQIASDSKPRERECLLEALVERASGAGMRAFELGSERV